jgi:hypothetical protein
MSALHEMGPQGELPREMARGRLAAHYQNYALVYLGPGPPRRGRLLAGPPGARWPLRPRRAGQRGVFSPTGPPERLRRPIVLLACVIDFRLSRL